MLAFFVVLGLYWLGGGEFKRGIPCAGAVAVALAIWWAIAGDGPDNPTRTDEPEMMY
jgi:hypothetical protein